MTDVLNFIQGGKLHLLAYEGLVTEVMAALIVLAVLIAFGHEGKRQRSLVWSGGGLFVILLVPGVCMGLEKLSTGSLGNGKSYMTIPAAAILSYGSVRLYEHYGRSFRNRLAVAFAVVIVILAGISVPYTFSLDKEFLQEYYPVLKGAAEFMISTQLKERPDGTVVVKNGWSPEHGPREDGVAHDQQIVRELFRSILAGGSSRNGRRIAMSKVTITATQVTSSPYILGLRYLAVRLLRSRRRPGWHLPDGQRQAMPAAAGHGLGVPRSGLGSAMATRRARCLSLFSDTTPWTMSLSAARRSRSTATLEWSAQSVKFCSKGRFLPDGRTVRSGDCARAKAGLLT